MRALRCDAIDVNTHRGQEQLRELLLEQGVDATQATLSRDLRELGVVKGPGGYALPGGSGVGVATRDRARELDRAVTTLLINAQPAASLAVLHTAPGHAQPLAVALDACRPSGVVGVLAGDDTVFLACQTDDAARSVVWRLRETAGLD